MLVGWSKPDRKGGACAELAIDRNMAPHLFHDLLADRQAQPRAVRRRVVAGLSAIKALKKMGNLLLGNTSPRILHRKRNPVRIVFLPYRCSQRDRAPSRCVIDGIHRQVGHDLREPARIDIRQREIGGQVAVEH